MKPEDMEQAYLRLSMLHTETMAELVETRRRMDLMSRSWWLMFKYWFCRKLGIDK